MLLAWRADVSCKVSRITWTVNGGEQLLSSHPPGKASFTPAICLLSLLTRSQQDSIPAVVYHMEKSSFKARSSLRTPEVSTVFPQVSALVPLMDVFVSS